MMRKTIVKAINLHKSFGQRSVVKGLSLEINEGEIFAVIGPNGAGKSTTIDILISLKKQDKGDITFWRSNFQEHIGVQLQTTPFFEGLTTEDNLRLFASFYKKKLTKEYAKKLLHICGLAEVGATQATMLSGGQQKKLAIAIAIGHNPSFLILDEPTAALDPRSRREIHEVMQSLKQNGTTILFTSHDMSEVEKIADRLIMIDHGKVVLEGKPVELCETNFVNSLEDLYLDLTKECV